MATSAFQIEGSPRCDRTRWNLRDEADRKARIHGVGHVRRTDEDLGLLSALGVDAYRFSLEWSRLVPRRRDWDRREMDRYVRIAARLREVGIEPAVTLHHFTNPSWLAGRYGWEHPAGAEEWLRFAERAVRALRDHVRVFVTFNEPNVFVAGGYLGGVMPPGRHNARNARDAYANVFRAHAAAYDMIHAQAAERASVGIAHNMVAFRTGVLSIRVPFLGYFWWSLMDNYEWLEGLRPRFGLYRVDFDTLERRPTASAAYFARCIRRAKK